MTYPQVLNRYTLQPGDEGVYIGRPSKWQNPFPVTKALPRDACIEKYNAWLLTQPELMEDAKRELRGKNLICFCTPRQCHGDTLFALANGPFVDAVPFEHYRAERSLKTHGYFDQQEFYRLNAPGAHEVELLYFDTPEQFEYCTHYYRVDFAIERPLVLLRQTLSCERLRDKAKTPWRKHYDAIVYTPQNADIDTYQRHGWLMFAKQQITSITRLPHP